MDFIDFAVGLVTGVIIGTVPDLIKHYSYSKHLAKLGDEAEAYIPLEGELATQEDPDDAKDREKAEEESYGFFS